MGADVEVAADGEAGPGDAASADTSAVADAFGPAADERAERLEQEARTLFEAGRMAFADGRFDDALASFQRAYDLSDRPILLFNIGTSLDRLQRREEAVTAFEQYLDRVPDAHNRSEVESRLRGLRVAVAEDQAREAQLREEEERRLALEAELAAERSDPFYKTWWFWTIVGAVVAGGIVTAAILAHDPGVADPQIGSTGLVSFTLSAGP